jgi:hypothetical protein
MNVRIVRILKTSYLEAGTYPLDLPDGASVLIAGHAYWPDHDRPLHEQIIWPALEKLRPDWVILAGGMIHDDPFEELAPRRNAEQNRVSVHHHPPGPELQAAFKEKIWENRVFELGNAAGRYIASWASAGNSKVLYVPSASQLMPREHELMQHLYNTQDYIRDYRKYKEKKDEGAPDPAIATILRSSSRNSSEDFAHLLGITDPRVQVCRFGAAVIINDDVLVEGSDFRRRNPVTSGYTQLLSRMKSIIKTFDGKTASGWRSAPGRSLPNTKRQFQFHEVGNLMDSERMGYLRRYDYWSKGIFFGRVVRGVLHGQSYPFLLGPDGRRSVVIDGHAFIENAPGGLVRREPVTARDLTAEETSRLVSRGSDNDTG